MSSHPSFKLESSIQASLDRILLNIVGFSDTFKRLEESLVEYPERLKQQSRHNEFLDKDLAQSLFETCQALLAYCRQNTQDPCVPYCLAAIDYFLTVEDAQSDQASLDGYEDDEQVLTQIIDHFSLAEKIKPFAQRKGA